MGAIGDSKTVSACSTAGRKLPSWIHSLAVEDIRIVRMKSTIAHKTLMALTGLFLCLFLTVHLFGNLQLFLPDGQARSQFNWYAETLSEDEASRNRDIFDPHILNHLAM